MTLNQGGDRAVWGDGESTLPRGCGALFLPAYRSGLFMGQRHSLIHFIDPAFQKERLEPFLRLLLTTVLPLRSYAALAESFSFLGASVSGICFISGLTRV